MSDDNLYDVPLDYQSGLTPAYAPATGRVGQAPGTAQGGQPQLLLNPSGKLAIGACDVSGNLLTVPSAPGGNPLAVTTGALAGAASTQSGPLMMGRMDLAAPVTFQAVTMDSIGAIQTHPKSKTTYRAVLAQVLTAAAKPLVSIYNGSTSQIIRLSAVSLYIPPQSVPGSLLGTGGTTYLPVYCQLHRCQGHATRTGTSASTTLTPVASDSADVLDSGVTILSNATITGQAIACFHRGDANNNGMGQNWFMRNDANCKILVLRPGEGAVVICVSNGLVASGSTTTQSSVDVEVVLTQSPG